jgi:O-antigen ligase
MIELLFNLTVAVCAVCAAVTVLWLVARHPPVGAALLMLAFLVEAVFITVPGVSLGLFVYPADIVTGLLLGGAMIRLLVRPARVSRYQMVVVGLLCVLLFAFLRGVEVNGVQASGVEARGTFYLLATALFFSTSNMQSTAQHAIQRMWLLSCLALLCIAILRWTGIQVGADVSEITGDNPMRVLVASQALFLASGFFLSLYLDLTRSGAWWERKMFYAIGPAIMLLQHRTLWLATIAALFWLVVRERRLRQSASIAAGTAIASVLVLTLLYSGDFSAVERSLQSSASNTQTWDWRIQGWQQLLGSTDGRLWTYALGTPLGGGFERSIADRLVNVSPHNAYLQVYLRMGAVGLGLFLTMYVACWRGLRRPVPTAVAFPDRRFYEVVLLLQMVYCITYFVGYPEGLMLGMLAAVVSRSASPATTLTKVSRCA